MRAFVTGAATWCGTGLSPFAPGTVGTLGAIPFYLVLARLPLPLYLLTTVAFIFFAAWISGRAEEIYDAKDPGRIVIDEVAGYLVTMTAAPAHWQSVLLGFFLFRFFDVVKIPPARYFDRSVKNGWGVVLDDVAAGVYACAVLHLALRLM
ncbi:phosphatidylglycerophosphatase A family protein [Geobacter pickeringii]|uniref:Phosphatidylglycerophosphatase n=1 Tax=Geobacter pickeringii TaxID=345632 RepID=A0A0B5B6N6_9BACT|nr:phosphatidylglycerophosphatase A [Geobacter pickeringii]AJE02207.1 phosphatidylglycerophosphatase [Geobacter pickeringii]